MLNKAENTKLNTAVNNYKKAWVNVAQLSIELCEKYKVQASKLYAENKDLQSIDKSNFLKMVKTVNFAKENGLDAKKLDFIGGSSLATLHAKLDAAKQKELLDDIKNAVNISRKTAKDLREKFLPMPEKPENENTVHEPQSFDFSSAFEFFSAEVLTIDQIEQLEKLLKIKRLELNKLKTAKGSKKSSAIAIA